MITTLTVYDMYILAMYFKNIKKPTAEDKKLIAKTHASLVNLAQNVQDWKAVPKTLLNE